MQSSSGCFWRFVNSPSWCRELLQVSTICRASLCLSTFTGISLYCRFLTMVCLLKAVLDLAGHGKGIFLAKERPLLCFCFLLHLSFLVSLLIILILWWQLLLLPLISLYFFFYFFALMMAFLTIFSLALKKIMQHHFNEGHFTFFFGNGFKSHQQNQQLGFFFFFSKSYSLITFSLKCQVQISFSQNGYKFVRDLSCYEWATSININIVH